MHIDDTSAQCIHLTNSEPLLRVRARLAPGVAGGYCPPLSLWLDFPSGICGGHS